MSHWVLIIGNNSLQIHCGKQNLYIRNIPEDTGAKIFKVLKPEWKIENSFIYRFSWPGNRNWFESSSLEMTSFLPEGGVVMWSTHRKSAPIEELPSVKLYCRLRICRLLLDLTKSKSQFALALFAKALLITYYILMGT